MADTKQYNYVLPKGYVLNGGENDYMIEEVLGKGGFGVTYKVKTRVLYKNIKIDAFFAVKEYFPDICSRESDNATIKIPETKQNEIVNGKNDFINEGLKLQEVCKLNPNIVKVNEVFEANGTAYYVLEYLEGGDLRKMVHENGGPLTEQQMLDVMLPVGKALQCLHDNQMLHLDVKPDNIVIRRNSGGGNDEPVLIDFGIATHFNNDGTPTSKTPSQGISPGYSPIEQYAQIEHFDPRIDVYAFCATCFFLLTGKDPIVAMEMTPDFVKNGIPKDVSDNVVNATTHGMTMNKNVRTSTIYEVLQCFEKQGQVPVVNPGIPTVMSKIETTQLEIPTQPKYASRENADPNDTKLAQSPHKAKLQEPQKRDLKKLLIGIVVVMGLFFVTGLLYWGMRHCTTSSENVKLVDTVKHDQSEEKADKTHQDLTDNVDFDDININNDILIYNYTNDSLVFVEGGTFMMGATPEQGSDAFSEEKPAHSVSLSSFYIGKTEVTQELWEAVMGNNPSEHKGNKLPVENVSWEDCQEFIRTLNAKTGKKFRLPTEAEWEYAARGGNRSQHYKFSGSNILSDVAWYEDNSGRTTHNVATKQANELGLYDMSGNVYEWCQDVYSEKYYSSSPSTNPQGPSNGTYCVNRGGSYGAGARYCRVSNRECSSRGYEVWLIGFRLAL